MSSSKRELRNTILVSRSKITPAERQHAALQINNFVITTPLFKAAQHIAFYMPTSHELDPLPIMRHALEQNKACYLPVIPPIPTTPPLDTPMLVGMQTPRTLHPEPQMFTGSQTLLNRQLFFVNCKHDTKFKANKFNILEPVLHPWTVTYDPQLLDIIFLPLVAFDLNGHRIGMGGGYYDCTLAAIAASDMAKNYGTNENSTFKSDKPSIPSNLGKLDKPITLGIAYSLQQVDHIEADPWDITMDGVITEKSGLVLF